MGISGRRAGLGCADVIGLPGEGSGEIAAGGEALVGFLAQRSGEDRVEGGQIRTRSRKMAGRR